MWGEAWGIIITLHSADANRTNIMNNKGSLVVLCYLFWSQWGEGDSAIYFRNGG